MPEYDTQEASSVISRLQEIRSVIQVAIEEQVKAKVFSKHNEASITPVSYTHLDVYKRQTLLFFGMAQTGVPFGEVDLSLIHI